MIALGCDHAGVELKKEIIILYKEKDYLKKIVLLEVI